ncbi:MAG: universal stress protein [Phycisphaerales bacterium]|jgi:nucleotide-binding universal stress UspA family protein|nr:universal stress protein [Phycisphaerales bacterium]MBT7170584.1 universal stress protein [Phycisphaerales bacterium]
MNTLLLCLDFCDQTDLLLDEARRIAPGVCQRIVLLHVAQPNPEFIGYDADPQALRDQMAAVYHTEQNTLRRHGETLQASLEGVEILPLLVQGSTGDKILSHAKRLGATLILMGTHGHGKLYNLVVGSTCQFVLQHTTTPLLLVPIRKE